MFGWFKPVCPIDLRDKVWVEQRLAWIIEQFGRERILNSPRILPTREFFPDEYSGTTEDAHALFARVCRYMGTDAKRFRVSFFTEKAEDDVLGLYVKTTREQPQIKLLMSLLPDQEAVISTMAHEIAHDLLLGAGLLTGLEPDHEQLTDLLPVALGMGTFHSNTAIKVQSTTDGNWSFWSIRRSGYLTAAVCGYAMGVIEWLRQSPASPSYALLGLDAAGAYKSGYRYLLKTGDCLIDRVLPGKLPDLRLESISSAAFRESDSRCLHVLSVWFDEGSPSPSQAKVTMSFLGSRDSSVQCAALEFLSKMQAPPAEIVDAILDRLQSSDETVRQTAITIVGRLNLPPTHVMNSGDKLLDELIWLTRSSYPKTALAAALALGPYRQAASEAVPTILALLARALICVDVSSDALLGSLHQIIGNVRDYLNRHPDVVSEPHAQLIRQHLGSEEELDPESGFSNPAKAE